jgi:MinD-like ATPase involved in chromosome partitioning or flagellar assembly
VTEIVSIHSVRGGTGKSNLTANLAATLASHGQRVAIIDTDVQSPGIHALFGLEGDQITHSLNDFLAERCTIADAAIEVGVRLEGTADGLDGRGRIHLVPSSLEAGSIARMLREGYDVSLLAEGVREIGDALALDTLLIDTHPGLNEETLLAITLSGTIVIVMRPDRQDFQGTAVTVEVARKLEVPRIVMVANKVPGQVDGDGLAAQIETSYGVAPTVLLPHSDELMLLGSGGLLCHEAADLEWSQGVGKVAAAIGGRKISSVPQIS